MQITSIHDSNFDEYKEYVTAFLTQWNVFNFYFNEDASVSVVGGVSITNSEVIKQMGRLPFAFHTIEGFMEVNHCGLTTLEGAPKKVTGMFACRNNQLTSLKGCPEEVESLYCVNNLLESLEGCPQTLRNLDISSNPLTSLKGISKNITGALDITKTSLTSLEGVENTLCNELDISGLKLNDLSFFPKELKRLYLMNTEINKDDLVLLPDNVLKNVTTMMGHLTTEDFRHALEMKQLNEKLNTELSKNQMTKRNKV